jgi:hypothetical protein
VTTKSTSSGEISVNPDERWVKCATLCAYLDISDDTVTRRAVAWQDDPVPHKFRFTEMVLNEGKEPEKRYWFPDAKAFLRNPPPSQAARMAQRLSAKPSFHVP